MKTYDFKQVAVSFGGKLLTGFAEGDAITIEPVEDLYKMKVGADGEVSRSRMNNLSHVCRLRLMQTSDANDIMTAFMLADQNGNGGVEPFFIKDGSGRSLETAEQAFVMRAPDRGFGAEDGTREWVVGLPKLVSNIAGN